MVAFRRAYRTAATMSGLFLVNEYVLQGYLGAGLVVIDVVEDIFLFPFCLAVIEVEVTAVHRSACVDSRGTHDLLFTDVLLHVVYSTMQY